MQGRQREPRKDFFAWLFGQNNSDLATGLFDGWHFLYFFVVFGGTLALSLVGGKFPNQKTRLRNRMAYLTVGLHVIDVFIMPLSDSYDGISAYKLPFNICTIMAVLSVYGVCLVICGIYFAQKALNKKKSAVA